MRREPDEQWPTPPRHDSVILHEPINTVAMRPCRTGQGFVKRAEVREPNVCTKGFLLAVDAQFDPKFD